MTPLSSDEILARINANHSLKALFENAAAAFEQAGAVPGRSEDKLAGQLMGFDSGTVLIRQHQKSVSDIMRQALGQENASREIARAFILATVERNLRNKPDGDFGVIVRETLTRHLPLQQKHV